MRRSSGSILWAVAALAAVAWAATVSPDGSVLKGGASGSLVTAAGTWTFPNPKPNGAGNFTIYLNGAVPPTGVVSGVLLEVANGGTLYDQLSSGQWYTFNGKGWVTSSAPPAPTPPPPAGQAGITFTWTPAADYTNGTSIPSSDAQTFNVFGGQQLAPTPPSTVPPPVNFTSVATGVKGTSYTWTPLTVGNTYCGVIQQCDSVKGTCSASSNQVCATASSTAPVVPAVPTGVAAAAVTVPAP